VGKENRHKTTLNSRTAALDAILAESRALRRQMADELRNESRKLERLSRHSIRPRRSTDPDEQSA
jgi:hypothetical protein